MPDALQKDLSGCLVENRLGSAKNVKWVICPLLFPISYFSELKFIEYILEPYEGRCISKFSSPSIQPQLRTHKNKLSSLNWLFPDTANQAVTTTLAIVSPAFWCVGEPAKHKMCLSVRRPDVRRARSWENGLVGPGGRKQWAEGSQRLSRMSQALVICGSGPAATLTQTWAHSLHPPQAPPLHWDNGSFNFQYSSLLLLKKVLSLALGQGPSLFYFNKY
jgi:hypothetical protein